MGRPAPARQAALRLLGQIRQRDAFARDVLRAARGLDALSPRDRALAERLVLGTVAARGTLDELLDRRLRRPKSVEPQARDAMRLAAFELLYLQTPERACVSQGVELVRSVAPHAAGLANAVLRRVAEGRYDVKRARIGLEVALLGTWGAGRGGDGLTPAASLVGALPHWLVRRVARQRTDAELASFALGELEPAPVWCAANLLRATADQAWEALSTAGAAPEPSPVPGAWLLRQPACLTRSGLAADGTVVPSDLSAQAVALASVPADGGSLLEVGSGRGTKTLLVLGQLRRLGWQARVATVELSATKASLAAERLADAPDGAVEAHVLDGRRLAEPGLPGLLAGRFSTVLVDAPCSGTGTMRRHPEIPWSLRKESVDPDDPDGLPALQRELLRAAAARVAPGGSLVYATCSVLAEENEQVVQAFLQSPEGARFQCVPVADAPALGPQAGADAEAARAFFSQSSDESGMFRRTPGPGLPDGHFCARLRRLG